MPTHHAVDYIELGVTELPATKAFYAAAFGWTFNDYGPAYAGIVTPGGEGEAGGLNASREPGRSGPLVLLFSRDLDATADAITAAGGTVVEGPYAFPGGRRLHFLDPSGNELGVWATS
ncbi:VOC family protein [Streptomyces sp. NPDC002640]